jgi:hypothetical protein
MLIPTASMNIDDKESLRTMCLREGLKQELGQLHLPGSAVPV